MLRNTLLVIHIAAAGIWLGASATQMVVAPMLTRQSGEVAAAWMTASMSLAKRLYPVAGAVVFAAGIGLVLVSDSYGFSDMFVGIGIVVVVLGGILGTRVFGPAAAQAADAYGSGDTTAGRAASTKIARFGLLDIALLLVAITAMVARWDV
jgi:hypothetical protein